MRIRVVMLAVLMFLLVAAALALPFVLRAPESIFHTSPMRISSSVFEHG
ncbi:MAG TPA: hypothetical protein PK765_05755 [bacterium]|nr:hypothetical protein [bacterium]